MPVLTPEQKETARQRSNQIYPGNRLQELNADDTVRTFWSSRADGLNQKLLEIDREQMRSAAESHNKWVRKNNP